MLHFSIVGGVPHEEAHLFFTTPYDRIHTDTGHSLATERRTPLAHFPYRLEAMKEQMYSSRYTRSTHTPRESVPSGTRQEADMRILKNLPYKRALSPIFHSLFREVVSNILSPSLSLLVKICFLLQTTTLL